MSREFHFKRLMTLGAGLVLCLALLGGRLYFLQVVEHDDLRRKSQDNTKRTFVIPAKRGDIKDSRGNVLATSLSVKTVCADPVLLGGNQWLVAQTLAPILKTNVPALADRLQLRGRRVERVVTNVQFGVTNSYRTNYVEPIRYVVLRHKVPIEDWQSITQAMKSLTPDWALGKLTRKQKTELHALRTRAIFGVDDQIRVYPNRTLAAHVLGSVGTAEVETEQGRVMEMSGREGIEIKYDPVLQGMRGWRQTETDRFRRELVLYREQDVPARAGHNVILTLDARLQDIVETALAEAMEKHAPLAGTAIMVRPKTGEILAMASHPVFDPDNAGATALELHRNRAISWLPEPGSTFKIVVVAGALNDGLTSLNENFDCENGVFIYAGRRLHDDHRYGLLSVEQIIAKSSNIGAAKIGIRMGKERLHQHIRNFGFGDPTGLPLPGEERGIVHPVKNWNALSISRVTMGHEIANTPLQMVMAMSAIANGGKLMRPVLVSRLEDEQGNVVEQTPPRAVRQVISPEAAALMVKALRAAVSTNGTGRNAVLEHYFACGKTGTAQKAGVGGYLPGKYISSFIGFLPAEDPELCIGVILDEPRHGHYGGDVAAPTFVRIAEQAANYLNIRPSMLTQPKAVPDAPASAAAATNSSREARVRLAKTAAGLND